LSRAPQGHLVLKAGSSACGRASRPAQRPARSSRPQVGMNVGVQGLPTAGRELGLCPSSPLQRRVTFHGCKIKGKGSLPSSDTPYRTPKFAFIFILKRPFTSDTIIFETRNIFNIGGCRLSPKRSIPEPKTA